MTEETYYQKQERQKAELAAYIAAIKTGDTVYAELSTGRRFHRVTRYAKGAVERFTPTGQIVVKFKDETARFRPDGYRVDGESGHFVTQEEYDANIGRQNFKARADTLLVRLSKLEEVGRAFARSAHEKGAPLSPEDAAAVKEYLSRVIESVDALIDPALAEKKDAE